MVQILEQPPVDEEFQAQARAVLDESAAASTGTTLFAVVDSNGALARGLGAAQASKIAGFTGAYQVLFNRNVSRGAYVASIGLSAEAGQSPPGEIVVNRRAGTTNGVFIQTVDDAGAPADRSFHLAVVLP